MRSLVCKMKRMATQRHVLDSAAADRELGGNGQQSGKQLFEALDAQVGSREGKGWDDMT